jgi:hypothetical protein
LGKKSFRMGEIARGQQISGEDQAITEQMIYRCW